MKITEVRLSIVEMPGLSSIGNLEPMPGMRRTRWLRTSGTSSSGFGQVMHVRTDEGIEGVIVGEGGVWDMTKHTLEQLRVLVIGEDPLARERLYQKLHTGTRWVYQRPGWAGTFDNCLWDIAGKAANLPVHALIGRVRDRVPMYMNIRGATKEEAANDAAKAVEEGFPAVKDHFYHPAQENIKWLRTVRDAVGPDTDIMHDPVGIYNFEEAVRVGRVLEELAYLWFEEPLPERQHKPAQGAVRRAGYPRSGAGDDDERR